MPYMHARAGEYLLKGKRAHVLTAALVVGGVVAVVLTLVWLLQRRLIYFPLSVDVPPVATVLPDAQEVVIPTADGLHLAGWFAPAGASRATVIVFNGNAGDRSFRAPLASALVRANFSVLLFDYRGYGRNPGSPSEQGLLADARAAHAYVTGPLGVDPARLVLFGESLGASVAVSLAVEQRPAALILRSPFTSLEDMARLHYPFIPAGPLLRDRFDSIGHIRRIECPVLVVAGERDQIVPPEHSRRLFEAIPGPRRFVLIPAADHNDFEMLAGHQLMKEIDRFLNEVLPGAGASD